MQECQWKFTIVNAETQFQIKKEGTVVAEAFLLEDKLIVSLQYDVRGQRLVLCGKAHVGQTVQLMLRDYRLELWIDGLLCDEEWPFGSPLMESADEREFQAKVQILPLPEEEETASFCGHFTNAEGWLPGNGVFVGDCMPYTFEDRYHVLYLKDRHHHHSKWSLGAHQWEHISTNDFAHWDIHPMAVPIDDPAEGSICTGSWIFEGGKHYLYYTIRTTDGSPAPIRRSVSIDGWHFVKDKSFSFTLSDRYTGQSARDPKVIKADDGTLHMFLTTTDKKAHRGCLAHLISEDGETFREIGNIYTAKDESEGEPECSDYFHLGKYYYLIFSHHGRGQYLCSREPFDGWWSPEAPYIPCSSVPKCSVWQGRILFAGFRSIGGYAGSMTFTEATPAKDGTLLFSKPSCGKVNNV